MSFVLNRVGFMVRLLKRLTATRPMGTDLMRFVAGNTIGLLAGISTGALLNKILERRLNTSPGGSI